MNTDTYLELSANAQQLRVVVDGKLIVTFHVNYVLKALAGLTTRTLKRLGVNVT